jgi:hypothetical protein
MVPKRTKQSSITSMGFLFFRRLQRCVWTDRSRFLDPTGKGTCEFTVSTGLLYPMTSSLIVEILDNTHPHLSETLRWLVRSVGPNEVSYTAKTRLCLRMQVVCLCRGWCTQRV